MPSKKSSAVTTCWPAQRAHTNTEVSTPRTQNTTPVLVIRKEQKESLFGLNGCRSRRPRRSAFPTSSLLLHLVEFILGLFHFTANRLGLRLLSQTPQCDLCDFSGGRDEKGGKRRKDGENGPAGGRRCFHTIGQRGPRSMRRCSKQVLKN